MRHDAPICTSLARITVLYLVSPPPSRPQISYGFSRFASGKDTRVPNRCDSCTAMIISSAARPSSPLEQARTGRSLLNGLDQFPHNDQIALVCALARRILFPLVQQHPFPRAVLLAGDP